MTATKAVGMFVCVLEEQLLLSTAQARFAQERLASRGPSSALGDGSVYFYRDDKTRHRAVAG